MIRSRNQQGFSVLTVVLIVVLVGIVGATGYYVWNANQSVDKMLTTSNESQQATSKPLKDCDIDGSMKAKLLSAKNNAVTFCVPNGWNLYGTESEDGKSGGVVANLEDLLYDPSKTPKLQYSDGGSDSMHPFSIFYGPANDEIIENTTGYTYVTTIKTKNGGEVKKYSHLTGKEDPVGSGIGYQDEGTMQYLYLFKKPKATVGMYYNVAPDGKDDVTTFDNIAATFN